MVVDVRDYSSRDPAGWLLYKDAIMKTGQQGRVKRSSNGRGDSSSSGSDRNISNKV